MYYFVYTLAVLLFLSPHAKYELGIAMLLIDVCLPVALFVSDSLAQQLGSALPVYDLKRRGLTCPICQDDFKDPISLACQVL